MSNIYKKLITIVAKFCILDACAACDYVSSLFRPYSEKH